MRRRSNETNSACDSKRVRKTGHATASDRETASSVIQGRNDLLLSALFGRIFQYVMFDCKEANSRSKLISLYQLPLLVIAQPWPTAHRIICLWLLPSVCVCLHVCASVCLCLFASVCLSACVCLWLIPSV